MPYPYPDDIPQALIDAIEEAASPYDALMSEDERTFFRLELAMALSTHPDSLQLLREIEPSPVIQASETTDIAGGEVATDSEESTGTDER